MNNQWHDLSDISVTIRKSATAPIKLHFDNIFVEAARIKEYNYVKLFYNQAAHILGLQFQDNDSNKAIRILNSGRNTSLYLSLYLFTKKFNIDPLSLLGTYFVTSQYIEGKGDCWLIDLNKNSPLEKSE